MAKWILIGIGFCYGAAMGRAGHYYDKAFWIGYAAFAATVITACLLEYGIIAW